MDFQKELKLPGATDAVWELYLMASHKLLKALGGLGSPAFWSSGRSWNRRAVLLRGYFGRITGLDFFLGWMTGLPFFLGRITGLTIFGRRNFLIREDMFLSSSFILR